MQHAIKHLYSFQQPYISRRLNAAAAIGGTYGIYSYFAYYYNPREPHVVTVLESAMHSIHFASVTILGGICPPAAIAAIYALDRWLDKKLN